MSQVTREKSRIAPEGLPLIAAALVPPVLGAIFGPLWLTAVLALPVLFILYFFRDPARQVPPEEGVVVSPGDGLVVEVAADTDDPGRPAEGYTRVSIFLSLFDVHVNRAPVAGEVTDVRHTSGRFVPAWKGEASSANERNRVEIRSAEGEERDLVPFTQIAGLVARRIACYLKKGEQVRRGQRMGLIRFGSRVEVLIPPAYQPTVKVGDRVRGGASILARREGVH